MNGMRCIKFSVKSAASAFLAYRNCFWPESGVCVCVCIHMKDQFYNFLVSLSRHTVVSAAKKTKKDAWHTSVLFTGTVNLPNPAFCILKTT